MDEGLERTIKWLKNQREVYKKGIFTENRTEVKIEKLKKKTGTYLDKDRSFDKRWNKFYNQLKQFIVVHKKYPSSTSKYKEEKRLGVWVVSQRQAKKGNGKSKELTEDRVSYLEHLPSWVWDLEEQWFENYEGAKSFIEKNGRYPNKHSENLEEKKLGYWIAEQRLNYKDNELSENRVSYLEHLPSWVWDLEEKWLENYNKVKQFTEVNNKYPSPCSKKTEEKKIGRWIETQRQAKKGNVSGNMTEERIHLLESLPDFIWNYDGIWGEKYNQLKQFVNVNNRYPSSNDKKDRELFRWVNTQRQARKGNGKGKELTGDKISLMEQLPNWIWCFEDQWEKSYNGLKLFLDNNNKYPNKRSEKLEEKSLGHWIANQKRNKKNNKITEERISLLEQLPGWSW